MKKILLMLCFIIGITAVSKAQIFVPEQRAKTLQTALKLNDEQTGKITGFYKALASKMDSVIKSGGDSDFASEMAETKAKIKSVLTKEQNAAYEKWLTEAAQKTTTERTSGPAKGN